MTAPSCYGALTRSTVVTPYCKWITILCKILEMVRKYMQKVTYHARTMFCSICWQLQSCQISLNLSGCFYREQCDSVDFLTHYWAQTYHQSLIWDCFKWPSKWTFLRTLKHVTSYFSTVSKIRAFFTFFCMGNQSQSDHALIPFTAFFLNLIYHFFMQCCPIIDVFCPW